MPARLEPVVAPPGGVAKPIPVVEGRPLMFRNKAGDPVARLTRDASGWRIEALNGSPVALNGGRIDDARVASGDEISVGRDRFRLVDDGPEVVEPFREPPTAAVTAAPAMDPAARSSRRISVSRPSAVAATSQSGVLDRVVAAFNGKDRARLASLEQERRRLLHDAGLSSLKGAGIGLPPALLSRLLRGEAVQVRLQDLMPGAVDTWRQGRRRLAELDTAIDAVRRGLGLPPENEAMLGPAPRSPGADPAEALADTTTQPIDPPAGR
jgi:hypothetical protein